MAQPEMFNTIIHSQNINLFGGRLAQPTGLEYEEESLGKYGWALGLYSMAQSESAGSTQLLSQG
jgi:hypothetical protein